jgi:hypothetical protein
VAPGIVQEHFDLTMTYPYYNSQPKHEQYTAQQPSRQSGLSAAEACLIFERPGKTVDHQTGSDESCLFTAVSVRFRRKLLRLR